MDALGAVMNIIDIAVAINDMVKGVKSNRKKCRLLAKRLEGIVEILNGS